MEILDYVIPGLQGIFSHGTSFRNSNIWILPQIVMKFACNNLKKSKT